MFDTNTYETVLHWQNYLSFCEHRLNGHRIILKPEAKRFLVPNQECSLTPWQLARLIENDLLETTDEPFALPAPTVITAAQEQRPSHNFVHADWMTIPFLWMADAMFDGVPPSGYRFETFGDHTVMAHLVAKVGAFKSVGDARRNGWDKPIPSGYSEHVIGKRKIQICILNKTLRMFEKDEDE